MQKPSKTLDAGCKLLYWSWGIDGFEWIMIWLVVHLMVLGDRFTHCVCTAVAVCCCKCNSWAYNGPDVDLVHWVWPSVTVTMTVAAKILWYLIDEESSSSSVAARVTGTTGRDELMVVAAARRLREKQRQRTLPSTSDAKTHGRQSPAVRERKEILTLLPNITTHNQRYCRRSRPTLYTRWYSNDDTLQLLKYTRILLILFLVCIPYKSAGTSLNVCGTTLILSHYAFWFFGSIDL